MKKKPVFSDQDLEDIVALQAFTGYTARRCLFEVGKRKGLTPAEVDKEDQFKLSKRFLVVRNKMARAARKRKKNP